MADPDIDELEPQAPPRLTEDELLTNEDAILEAMFEAGEVDKSPGTQETKVVHVRLKNGKTVYIRLRGLDEDDEERCRKRARSRTKQEKRGRAALLPDVDSALFRSFLILEATVAFCLPIETEEGTAFKDVQTMWSRSDLRARLGVQANVDVIDKVLPAGQKSAVIQVIEELSGYENESIEAEVKN